MEFLQQIYKDKISEPLSKVLIKHKITPNQITVGNHVVTLTLVIYAFSRGTWAWSLFGCFLMGLNVIFDYADGDVARRADQKSNAGEWLDSVFDIVIQNAVMASIALGCYKMGMQPIWVAIFFVSNNACNVVSLHYNNTFGFNSHSGNATFRKYMEMKPNYPNRFFKNIIDPTASAVGLGLFTARYYVLAGALFNCMPFFFIAKTLVLTARWSIMYLLMTAHLFEYKKLWVLQALAFLDPNRKEYYVTFEEKGLAVLAANREEQNAVSGNKRIRKKNS